MNIGRMVDSWHRLIQIKMTCLVSNDGSFLKKQIRKYFLERSKPDCEKGSFILYKILRKGDHFA